VLQFACCGENLLEQLHALDKIRQLVAQAVQAREGSRLVARHDPDAIKDQHTQCPPLATQRDRGRHARRRVLAAWDDRECGAQLPECRGSQVLVVSR
jgi:hypothetical protein